MLKEQEISKEIIEHDKDYLFTKYSNIIAIETIESDDELLDMIEVKFENDKNMNRVSNKNELLFEKCVTLKRLVIANSNSDKAENQEINTYYIMAVSGTTRNSTGSKSASGVTLTGTIVWEDILDPINKFINCSGSRSGSYRGTGSYEVYRSTQSLCSGYFNDSFVGTSSLTDLTGYGFMLQVRTFAENTDEMIVLEVRTSIFD